MSTRRTESVRARETELSNMNFVVLLGVHALSDNHGNQTRSSASRILSLFLDLFFLRMGCIPEKSPTQVSVQGKRSTHVPLAQVL